jgi:putative holliday junction resolvase
MTVFNISNHLNQDYKKYLPSKGRILAIDVGTKKIGISISDETRIIATPKLIIKRQSNQKDFAKILEFITQNFASAIVIGRPVQMDNSITKMTIFSENFAKNFDIFLEQKFPIFLFEERLSSFEAQMIDQEGISKRHNHQNIDDIASSIILQHFLDFIKF